MKQTKSILFRPLPRVITIGLLGFVVMSVAGTCVFASTTSNFQQTINAGALSVDIVDGSFVTVASPSITMGAVSFDLACQTATGTFGTVTEQIYVRNPDAADSGWHITLKGSGTTDVWDSAGTDYDFNDAAGSGCTDGADADGVGGQMTVDASGGTLDTGQCAGCAVDNITKGSSGAYAEGATDEITLLTGAAGSDDVGDWTLQGVSVSQKVPAEQPAASDYDIDMVLSIYAP